MSFIRPEAAAQLRRWREALVGGAACAVGAYLALTGYGAAFLIGLGLTIGGGALAIAGIQRARFRQGAVGPGILQIDEGRVTYLGPFGGGSAAVRALVRIDLDTRRGVWLLWEEAPGPLEIPLGAAGADGLFDAFAALPGLDTGAMLSAIEDPAPRITVIWERDRARLH